MKSNNKTTKKNVNIQQGDIFSIQSNSCWSYDFDADRIIINDRWPLEELHHNTIVMALEQRMLPYSQVYGGGRNRIAEDVQMIKIIPPSGKVGWVVSHHLMRL